MSLPIHVDAYSGYKAMNGPDTLRLMRMFTRSPQCSISGKNPQRGTSKCRARKERRTCSDTDEWTLQSGFDGDELLARPSIELVTIDALVAKKAEQQIESCEHCHPGDAEIPFDWLLAEVTGKRGAFEFILSEPARSPNCKHLITEKTLIEPRD